MKAAPFPLLVWLILASVIVAPSGCSNAHAETHVPEPSHMKTTSSPN